MELDGLWLFDGVCNFCSGSVRLFLKLDRRGDVFLVPLQSTYGRQIAEAAGLDPEAPLSFVFFDRGLALQKSAAVLALLGRLPPPWRWARVMGILPENLRDGAYDWIAANRYRLMGKRDVCMVPSDKVRARFLTEPPNS